MARKSPRQLVSFFLVSILISFILVSCSGDDTPTEPPVTETELVSATIDADGGFVEHADISLVVPPGAFTEPTEITLVRLHGNPAGTESETAYRLDGLPEVYSETLAVFFPNTVAKNSSSEDEPVFLVGEDAFVSSLNRVTTRFISVQPLLAADQWVVTLPPSPTSEDKHHDKVTDDTISVIIVEEYDPHYMVSSDNHFMVTWLGPTIAENDIAALCEFLEEAYEYYPTIGFSYAARTNWPMSILVKPMGLEMFGGYANSKLGNNYGTMEINSFHVSDQDAMRVTAGHEFFHMVQSFHDMRWFMPKAISQPVHHWLNEGTAVWAEEVFSDDLYYVSAARDGVEKNPFLGLVAGRMDDAEVHGYGMSALIKYLVMEHGANILPEIYSYIDLDYKAIEALDLAIGNFPEWWDDFLIRYVNGEIYDVSPTDFIGIRDGRFRVRTEDDTDWSHTGSYPDLSGKLFQIQITDTELPESANLDLTLTGSFSKIHVFSYNASGISLLASAEGNLNISGLREIQENGRNLLVLTTQSHAVPEYLTQESLTLTAKINRPEIDLSGMDQVYVQWCLHLNILYEDETSEVGGVCLSDWLGGTELVIDGTSFSSIIDQSYEIDGHVEHYFGSVTGTLSTDLTQIQQVTSELSMEKIFSDQTVQIGFNSAISANGLPLENSTPTTVSWGTTGNDACAVIVNHEYETSSWVSTGHSCTGSFDFIRIRFQ